MKKALFMTSLFACSVASATTTIFQNTNLCLGSDSVLTTDVADDIATSITTSGNSQYSVYFGQDQAGLTDISLTTTKDIYLNTFGTNGFSRTGITSLTLNLQNGGITTAGHFEFDNSSAKAVAINFGENGYIYSSGTINFTQHVTSTFTFTADVDVASLTTAGLDRTLMTASASQKMWNSENVFFQDRVSLTVESLDNAGYTNLGVVNYIDGAYYNKDGQAVEMTNFSYALVFDDLKTSPATGTTKIHMLVTTPEPATATLSLLALAGLAARRRRH